jgi:hypothetical protein
MATKTENLEADLWNHFTNAYDGDLDALKADVEKVMFFMEENVKDQAVEVGVITFRSYYNEKGRRA